jgi:hypothetical protein
MRLIQHSARVWVHVQAQEQAIVAIEIELERARTLIESDSGVRVGTEEATVVEAKKL